MLQHSGIGSCHGSTAVSTGPFHEECARFAVATCPYLRRTDDPQFATFCRRYAFVPATFPLTSLDGRPTQMRAFMAHAIVRVEPVGKWAA
jgi:hypothetical protein